MVLTNPVRLSGPFTAVFSNPGQVCLRTACLADVRRRNQESRDLETICSISFRLRKAKAKAAVIKQGRKPQASPARVAAIAGDVILRNHDSA